jgi:hypothetical protein
MGRLMCQFVKLSDWFPCKARTRATGEPLFQSENSMAKSRKSLIKPRSIAFTLQAGRCFYCSYPMWSENPHEFASKHKITLAQAKRFQCTGEHLRAHQDGGSSKQHNIVAACLFCNQKRHSRKEPPPPDQYKELIHQRMSQGRWHDVRLN